MEILFTFILIALSFLFVCSLYTILLDTSYFILLLLIIGFSTFLLSLIVSLKSIGDSNYLYGFLLLFVSSYGIIMEFDTVLRIRIEQLNQKDE